MPRPTALASLAGAYLPAGEPAFAHSFAGPHMFVSTLVIDDPNVADEALLPTFSYQPRPSDGSANGWENFSRRLKYKFYVSAEHEFMISIGVVRNFARTGATGENGATLDNDDSSSTAPTFHFGEGFGLPEFFNRLTPLVEVAH